MLKLMVIKIYYSILFIINRKSLSMLKLDYKDIVIV